MGGPVNQIVRWGGYALADSVLSVEEADDTYSTTSGCSKKSARILTWREAKGVCSTK